MLALLLSVSFDVVNCTHEIQVYSISTSVNSIICDICKQRLDAVVMLSWFRPFIGDLKFSFCSLTFNIHYYCIQEAVINDSIWCCHFLKNKRTFIYGRAVILPSKTFGEGGNHWYSTELESFMLIYRVGTVKKFWE
jgi:hypothetical protein